MKKTIFLMLVLVASTHVGAQALWDNSRPDKTVTVGLRAGINFAHADADCATSSHLGIHGGVAFDYNIIKSFALSTGLYYVGKGFRGNQNITTASASTESKCSAAYLQLPVLASWRIEAPSGVRFHINFGPYLACGIGGKAKYKPLDLTFIDRFDNDTFGSTGLLKRFDAGLSFGADVVIGHMLVGASYELGLTNVGRQARFDAFHNRNANLTIGYNF